MALPLIDKLRSDGFKVETAAMDKGYDLGPLYDGREDRGIRPIMPLRMTPAVKAGADEPPRCEHGLGYSPGRTTSARRPADLTILAKLACALARARAVPLAA